MKTRMTVLPAFLFLAAVMTPTLQAQPVVSGFTPKSGALGTYVTITGANFSSTPLNDVVYFGGVRAGVTAASPSSLTVLVPPGATYAPITVTVGGLTAATSVPFQPTFSGGATNINPSSLGTNFNLATGGGPGSTVIADFDGDGQPDIAEVNGDAHTVSIFRNVGTPGTLNSNSFAARVDLPLPVGNNGGNPYRLRAVDLDGDGKLDLIVCEVSGSRVSLFHNVTTPGIIAANSFEPPVTLNAGADCRFATAADLDGDGRVDIVALNYGGNSISLFRNVGTSGTLATNSFAAPVNLPAAGGPYEVAIGDLDGDGKPDLAVANADVSVISVFRNQATAGMLDTNSFTARVDIASQYYGHTIAIGDLDGDGKPDLTVGFVTPDSISVYRNLSTPGSFTASSLAAPVDFALAGWGHTVALSDIDGDGKTDIVAVGELPSYLYIFKNVSTPGAFDSNSLAPRADFGTGWNAWGVAVGDLNADSRPDIVFCNAYDANITVYPNAVPFSTQAPGTNCATISSGFVSWWRAEGDASDSVGNNNGTLSATGASFTNGLIGRAFIFDGTNGFASVPDSDSLKPTNLTCEAWVWLDPSLPSGRGGEQIVFKKNTWSAWFEGYSLLKSTVDNGDGTFSDRFEFTVSRSGNQVVLHSHTIAQRGVWYHVAATYDGNQSILYVNGVAEVAATPGFPLDYDTAPLFIGTSGTWAPYLSMFGGVIDEVSLYNRALSPGEIAAIYNAGNAGKCVVALPPSPPIIVTNPASQTVSAGSNVSFTVVASGSAPLSYQWWFKGAPLIGPIASTLFINDVKSGNAGDYFVVVTNTAGAVTSSVATLSVIVVPPVIIAQPTNLTLYFGSNATFRVTASGSPPLSYQWFFLSPTMFSPVPIPGQTSSTLVLNAVKATNAGGYAVIVTNSVGAVTSAVAQLTVKALPSCTPPPSGLVSWWRAETNANDGWDSNNGTSLNTVYAPGKVGMAFSFQERSFVRVPDSLSLRMTNALTIEAWVNPSSAIPTPRTILSKFEFDGLFPQGGLSGTQSSYYLGTTNNGLLVFRLSPNGSTRTNATLISTQRLATNQWSHVAATYDGSTMRIFINGQQDLKTNYAGGIFPGNANLGIGGIPFGESFASLFVGLIDEMSIYNRALTEFEIQQIYNADIIGKCLVPPSIVAQPQSQAIPLGEDVKFAVSAQGSQPLRYQWRFNGQNLGGATNSYLVLEKVQSNRIGNYSVIVTNAQGTNLSSNAALTLLPAPGCTATPDGLISWWPADSNIADAMATNNISSFSPALYTTGKVSQAFSFNGISSRITVPNSASVNFGSNADFSIELWIKAGASNTTYANVPFFEKLDSNVSGYSLSLYQGRLAFALANGPASSTNLLRFISPGPDLRDTMFHHVSVSVNRTNPAGGNLYVDGQLVLNFDPTPRRGSLINGTPLYLGAPTTATSNSYFAGLIDEPALYGRALSAAEIQAIRNAGAAGKCKVPPAILTQPLSQRVPLGSNVTFTVMASGTARLRYQWLSNSVPLAGATNQSLTFTTLNNSGANYAVRVTNLFGSILSSSAVLTVNFAPVVLDLNLSLDEDTSRTFGLPASDANLDPLTYFIVSQPAHGTLSAITNWPFAATVTYTPAPNYNGPDSFIFKANDGLADSALATVSLTVLPVNDPPVVQSQSVALDEDTPAPITLGAFDVDGDTLTYTIGSPAHGTLSGTAPNLTYTPATNYFGPDSFTFSVTDGQTNSGVATVSLTVRPVNDAPFARISVSPLADFPGVTNQIVISGLSGNASVVLDGSQSSDVENDPLQYFWSEGTNQLATGVIVTNEFAAATHDVKLTVSDGALRGSATTEFDVLTPAQSVGLLIAYLDAANLGDKNAKPLLASLRAAASSFERGDARPALNQLQAFQTKVQAQLAVSNPALTAWLVDGAQQVIDAVNGR